MMLHDFVSAICITSVGAYRCWKLAVWNPAAKWVVRCGQQDRQSHLCRRRHRHRSMMVMTISRCPATRPHSQMPSRPHWTATTRLLVGTVQLWPGSITECSQHMNWTDLQQVNPVTRHIYWSSVSLSLLPSVLWRCWLGSRKGIRPVKNWVVGFWRGYLSGARCRLAYGPADATATHCLLLQ